MQSPLEAHDSARFLAGGGEMERLIRAYDWTTTPLGQPQDWPNAIKTTVGLMLRSPVPIVALFGDVGIMIYNDAYSVFAGGRHPQLLGSEVRKGWPEVADFNDNVMRVGLAGGTLSYQNHELTLYRTGAPEQVFMNLDYSPVLDESGRPVGVIAFVVETSKQVNALAQLRENEEQLKFLDQLGRETARSSNADDILATSTRVLGEYLGVSVCAYADMEPDQDHFTIRGDWCAPGSASIQGYYSLAAFGQLAVERLRAGEPLVINDNRRELPPHEAATFQSIGLTATICMPLVKDGRLTALMAVHDKAARTWTPRELALLTEVTERSWAHIERVRSEAASREGDQRFRAQLEDEVAQRTAELQQSQRALLQAQKMEAIGNLTGGIAHDFNNLLMAVMGSLEMLRKRLPDDPRLLRFVDNAMEGARRGSSLTGRMLAFARRQELRTEQVDPAGLVAGMAELLQRSLGPMVQFETAIPFNLPLVMVDPNQLESALLNLAVNARDAMDNAGRLTISGREAQLDTKDKDLAAGRYVVLAVADTGEGMDAATLARASEPFFTTKGVGKGTGLGLSMVQGFAEQSGGRLALKSQPGTGTTAEIWLPVAYGGAALIDSNAPRPEIVAAAPTGALTILAVDDDALVLMNTVDMLEDLGHTVTEAYSGKDALKLLAEGHFDMVITDHAMPHMTGAQLASEIRARWPQMPIILATGYAELPPGTDTGLPRLTKPFTQNDLERMLAEVR